MVYKDKSEEMLNTTNDQLESELKEMGRKQVLRNSEAYFSLNKSPLEESKACLAKRVFSP